MFSKIRLWLVGSSGLREATRDAAREATREGLLEGFRLGSDDFISALTGISTVATIEAPSNGHQHALSASELRAMRKDDLVAEAESRGILDASTLTAADLRDRLAG